ncbi:uncharacterized protein C8A04DRAFT_37728 [Dichotomopilus funicola]|uniref:Uncharacterized protein n=1 Tax=Dichotomopilus funicola TaxID=1934379 RepID=A0AAN6V1M6_9PEZI|nr:hypothetical protein C8A04DRAFT_37728 [Dichotomopilus funicola]
MPPPFNLPFEIQRLILSQAPMLDTLRALVHASPRLHSVYAQDRLHILRAFVEQSLEGIFLDAYAAYRSGTDEFQLTRDEPMIWDFVHDFENKRNGTNTPQSKLTEPLALDDLVQLVRFHHAIVEPLTERYSIWALAALSSAPQDCPLSWTEKVRIQRALYRFQIFCNLCGSRGEGRSSPQSLQEPLERLRVLSLFPAWQIEEILCIQEFGKDTYGGIFDRVAWDLNEERNPGYKDLNLKFVRESLLLFSGPPSYDINRESREAMLRHGLPVLAFAFKKLDDHDGLVELVRDSILSVEFHGAGMYSTWMDEAVQDIHQHHRREQWYSEQYDGPEKRKEKTPFVKDTPDQPPLAWVTFWYGKASNFFGPYVHEAFRRWGFVMWDGPRLRASGALVHMYWAGGCPGCAGWDPRESFSDDED